MQGAQTVERGVVRAHSPGSEPFGVWLDLYRFANFCLPD